jgi:hypothetical protein
MSTRTRERRGVIAKVLGALDPKPEILCPILSTWLTRPSGDALRALALIRGSGLPDHLCGPVRVDSERHFLVDERVPGVTLSLHTGA